MSRIIVITMVVSTIMVILMMVNLILMMAIVVVDDDASIDLNIASNFELVSCNARGAGGKAREAP